MATPISIKDFRQNLSQYADRVAQGEIIDVFRRSKFAFRIVPEQIDTDERWETVVDFTEGGTKSGIKPEKLLEVMQNFETKHG